MEVIVTGVRSEYKGSDQIDKPEVEVLAEGKAIPVTGLELRPETVKAMQLYSY